jgi:hypothetical protein
MSDTPLSDNDELLRSVHTKVCRIETWLTGGEEPSRGIIVRLDRVEQSSKIVSKLLWGLIGGILTPGGIGAIIYYLVSEVK